MTETELTDPDLRRQRQRLDMAKLTMSGLAVILCAVILAVVVVVLSRITSVTDTIADCTNPKGQCAQQVQRQAAENRAQLVNASVAANYCAKSSTTLEELQACVTRTLQEIGDR